MERNPNTQTANKQHQLLKYIQFKMMRKIKRYAFNFKTKASKYSWWHLHKHKFKWKCGTIWTSRTHTTKPANDNIMLHRRKNSFNKYAHRTFKSNKKKQENKKHIKLLWLFIQNGCVGLALWKSSGSVQKLIKFVCIQIYYCHIILHGKDHRRFNLRCKRFVFRSKIQNRNFNSCACHAVIKYLRPLSFFCVKYARNWWLYHGKIM